MVASARALSPKKRQWIGGARTVSSKSSRRAQHPRLLQCRVSEGSAGETDSESLDLDDVDMDDLSSDIQTLPDELLALALAQLDGQSLLACAATCRTFRTLTFDRQVWKRICLKRWPTLRTQLLPQLPGAPDYDLVRLYGGCWRRCYEEKHGMEQRAEMSVKIPKFTDVEAMRSVDKVVSDTFNIGAHRFCLWVFPNGNPNEAQYKDRVLSVYLVLTDLSRRAPDWLTCAVFSLQVENARDPRRRLEWHSCLTDNKFHRHLNNWGVHSLGSLSTLRDPQQGFLTNSTEGQTEPDILTVSAQIYVENNSVTNDLPLDLPPGAQATAKDLLATPEGYVFVKLLQPAPANQLDYIGKFRVFETLCPDGTTIRGKSESGRLAPSWSCAQLEMFREEIAPTVVSELIPYHAPAQSAGLQQADIVVFCVRPQGLHGVPPASALSPVYELLLERYAEARQLFSPTDLAPPTLELVENLAEKLDIPKFRVRSAFRKCHEDPLATLRYIMDGRHLGFICDSCGETDFTGPRFNCAICSDYDLCAACNAQACEISHRYANVDGKWQRVYNFKDHKTSHTMRKMLPVFYGYGRNHDWQPAAEVYCRHC
uniref:ZZ-type domain-containing protein n=1 Tax=Phytophthora ramorum TaxID=164328 RepID=H3HBF4_PHYRM